MTAREFFHIVELMQANKRAFERLEAKSTRTTEEENKMKQYFDNWHDFEQRVYEEIKRVNKLLQEMERTKNGN